MQLEKCFDVEHHHQGMLADGVTSYEVALGPDGVKWTTAPTDLLYEASTHKENADRLLALCQKQMETLEAQKADWKTVHNHLKALEALAPQDGRSIGFMEIGKIIKDLFKPENNLTANIAEMFQIAERNAR
jgi:hypothetical protein